METDAEHTLPDCASKVRRAQILLKADIEGASWPDAQIADAFNCRMRSVEKLRKRVVVEGFALALNGKKREHPPTPPKMEGEAKLIALRLGKPPVGYGRWTLHLLADELVALEIVDQICPETVRKTLKK